MEFVFLGVGRQVNVCDANQPLNFQETESESSPSRVVTIPSDASYRILQSCAYYLPTYQIAGDLLTWLESHRRIRAYDIMLCRYPQTRYFVYPALVTNRVGVCSSRDGRTLNRQDLLYYR